MAENPAPPNNEGQNIQEANNPEDISLATSESASFSLSQLSSEMANSIDDLAQTIDNSSNNLEEAILKANNKSFFDHSIVITITSALIAGMVAYITNILYWKYINKAEGSSKIANALSEAINNLEENSVNYWLFENKAEKQLGSRNPEIIAKEIKIKSDLKLVRQYADLFLKCTKKEVTVTDTHKISNFPIDMYELITGEDFETTIRLPSQHKASQISSRCSSIQLILSSYIHTI